MTPNQPNHTLDEDRWSLPGEIFRSLHQWHRILIFTLVGALVGWVLAFLIPASYKATQQVYVGINPYRSFSDVNFLAIARPRYSNIDDYKNWQMTQLDSVLYLNEILDATLENLQQEDSYWNQYNREQLSGILDVDWRTAGIWSLTATHPDPLRAEQAARAWREVAVSRVNQAIIASQQAILIDQELQSNADASLQAKSRVNLLGESKLVLQEWLKKTKTLPADQPLSPTDRAYILPLAVYPAQFSPAWSQILDDQPLQIDPVSHYREWIDRIIQQITFEEPLLSERISKLELDREKIASEYAAQFNQSLGLSANLTIEDSIELSPQAERTTGLWVLLGSLIGLLTWGVIQTISITKRLPVK